MRCLYHPSRHGLLTRACAAYAVQADEASVETIEGLGKPEALAPLQAAFQEHHALQCGFCTPGILMSAKAFLDDFATVGVVPTEQQVREMLSGHICRCTGYDGIVKAILACAEQAIGTPLHEPR